MCGTPAIRDRLAQRGFENLVLWSRGVDTTLFTPAPREPRERERPIFLYVGRVAVEKNIEAFCELELAGDQMGRRRRSGPRARFKPSIPDVRFFGMKHGRELAAFYQQADVFVFPSRTDTFGLVLIEAMACGTPVAAYPVTGPLDVVTDHPRRRAVRGPAQRRARRARLRPRCGAARSGSASRGNRRRASSRRICNRACEPARWPRCSGVRAVTLTILRRRCASVAARPRYQRSRDHRADDEQPGNPQQHEREQHCGAAEILRALGQPVGVEADAVDRRLDARVQQLDDQHQDHGRNQKHAFRRRHRHDARERDEHSGEQDFLAERAFVAIGEPQPRERIEERVDEPAKSGRSLVWAFERLGSIHRERHGPSECM